MSAFSFAQGTDKKTAKLNYNMSDTNNIWEHIKTVVDGERCEINGLNIWDCEWKDTGERIQIKDPLYGQDFIFSVYEISNGQIIAKFATGEFSNCVWGVYLKKEQV